jgi:hypothetical protein
MKLSTKNLLIIFGILAIVFIVSNLTKREGRSKSLRTELIQIDTADVTKIIITSPNGSVELNKIESVWSVALDGSSKQTKKNTVESMLNNLNSIKPSRLASRKKEKWGEYAVDSTGTRIRLFAGDEIKTDIVLGRFGVEGQRNFYTFVRLFEEENVYVANDFMKMSVYENPDDYRNNELLRLKKDSLTQVTFDYPEGSFSLVKNQDWFLGDSEADSTSVAGFLQDLNYLSSKEFENNSVSAFTHKVTFSFTNQPEIVVEGAQMGENPIIKSSENQLETFNDSIAWDKLFKQPDVFAKTND